MYQKIIPLWKKFKRRKGKGRLRVGNYVFDGAFRVGLIEEVTFEQELEGGWARQV